MVKKGFWTMVFVAAMQWALAQVNVEYVMYEGKRHINAGEFGKAISRFDQVINYRNDEHEAWFLRGVCKYYLDDFYGATTDLNVAIGMNAYNSDAFRYRAVCLSELQRYPMALDDFDRAIALETTNADLFADKGLTLLLAGQGEKAITEFEKALRLKPQAQRIYLLRGLAYQEISQNEHAMADYDKVIHLNHFSTEAFIRRGTLLAKMGQHTEAISDFEKAIRLVPNTPLAYYYRSISYSELQQFDAAMADLDMLIDLKPDNPVGYFNRAMLRFKLADYHGSIDDYTKVARLSPQNALVYFNRGIVFHQLGMLPDAVNDYSHSIAILPEFISSYHNRSLALQQMGQLRAAKRDMEKAKSLNKLQQAQKDSLLASAKFDRAMQLDGNFVYNQTDEQLSYERIQRLQQQLPTYELRFSTQPQRPKFIFEGHERLRTLGVEIVPSSPNDSLPQPATQPVAVQLQDSALAHALALADARQFSAAIAKLDKIIAHQPNSGLAYFARAMVRKRMYSFISLFSSKNQVIAYTFAKGQTENRYEEQDYSEVIADLSRTIELMPDFCYAYYNRAIVLSLSNMHQQAIYDYNQAINLQNQFAEAYYNRATCYLQLGQTTKACNDLSQAGALGIEQAYALIKRKCARMP